MRRTPTIRDVAEHAGVSISTVSRALNASRAVDPELVEQVRQAAGQLGYIPNQAGRDLRRRSTSTWTVIVPDLNTFFAGVVTTFELRARALGHPVMLCTTGGDIDYEQAMLEMAGAQHSAGVLAALASTSGSHVDSAVTARQPVVLFDRLMPGWGGDAVVLDNRAAGALAAAHLVKRGFRRLGCIAGPGDVATTNDRLTGFADAARELGHPVDVRHITHTSLDPTAAQHAAMSLLTASGDAAPPDALYCVTGPLTLGAYQALRATGQRLGIVGQDDDPWTALVDPPLTVVAQPVEQFGEVAARLLSRRADKPQGSSCIEVLSPTLVVRASSLLS